MTAAATIDAMDGVVSLILAAWGPRPLRVPNVAFDAEKTLNPKVDSWAWLNIWHATGQQSTLADTVGMKRFEYNGTIIVQAFSPLGIGLKKAYDEADILRKAFEGKRTSNDVWFRNVRSIEVGESGVWYQMNVLADFTYEMKG